jgi:hypothetical protein
VAVDSAGATFTVQVTGSARLRVVLEALCAHAAANCTLPASLPETLLEPRVIRGSWPDVVAELLQHSGLGFAATPAAPSRSAYLMVEASAPAKAATGRIAASDGRATAPSVEASGASPLPEEALAQLEAAAPEEAPVAEVGDEPSVSAADPEAILVNAATAAATPGANFAATPFTDGKGNPLMARLPAPGSPSATPGMAVLPYLDEAGYPMTVPITNEPLSLTPFVGPDGQAWPAPVPQPGQKLEYPIPPTVPPATKPENQ